MKALIQRVSEARVVVDGSVVGEIAGGILLLLGVSKGDTEEQAKKLLERVLTYRIFYDEDGKMNKSLLDTNGELLIVSQFTLSADTQKGTRPSFSSAEAPERARELYEYFIEQALPRVKVATGRFGADMKVSLTNDGPVTFLLEV